MVYSKSVPGLRISYPTIHAPIRTSTTWALACGILLRATSAYAGGLELPDLGGQALGRGAAFTARADDGMALYYNVAGLARQRGTHILGGGNLVLHQFQFHRSGQYPKADTPYDSAPYPAVVNTGGPGFLPAGVITTDFGGFDRLTFAAGVFTPSVVPNRSFDSSLKAINKGQTIDLPAPGRLDIVRNGGLILQPTFGVGFRVSRAFDIGVSAGPVLWTLDSQQSLYMAADVAKCAKPEAVACIQTVKLTGSASSFTGALGMMVRPSPSTQLGAQFRLPTTLTADTTFTEQKGSGATGATGTGTVEMSLPWVLRMGARYIKMQKTVEVYDLEADLTVEGWSGALGGGMPVTIKSFGDVKDVKYTQRLNFNNTFSLRVGGGYNMDLEGGVFTIRGGGFFDSTATAPKYTRAAYDSLGKFGATIGAGYKTGPFTVNLGLALIASVPRTVTDGEMTAPNLLKGGNSVDAADAKLSPYNRGTYWGATQMVSLSVDFALDSLWEQRGPSWGDPRYEVLTPAGAKAKPKADEDTKEDAPKEDTEKKDDAPKEEGDKDGEGDKSKKKKDPENPFS